MSAPPHPNQWHTPVRVSIHRQHDDTEVYTHVFSDLQMAWLHIRSRVGVRPRSPNYLKSFEHTIERLREFYEDNERGYVCAEKDGLEYTVFYEVPRQNPNH
jgi:hypothetical protein